MIFHVGLFFALLLILNAIIFYLLATIFPLNLYLNQEIRSNKQAHQYLSHKKRSYRLKLDIECILKGYILWGN